MQNETFDTTNKIMRLNSDDFDSNGSIKTRLNNKLSFVLFFAPWCGHCHVLKPEFLQVAKQLQHEIINIASYDSTFGDNLAKMNKFSDFRIPGFPMMILFENGKYKESYNGKRTSRDIVDFIQTKLAQTSQRKPIFSYAFL